MTTKGSPLIDLPRDVTLDKEGKTTERTTEATPREAAETIEEEEIERETTIEMAVREEADPVMALHLVEEDEAMVDELIEMTDDAWKAITEDEADDKVLVMMEDELKVITADNLKEITEDVVLVEEAEISEAAGTTMSAEEDIPVPVERTMKCSKILDRTSGFEESNNITTKTMTEGTKKATMKAMNNRITVVTSRRPGKAQDFKAEDVVEEVGLAVGHRQVDGALKMNLIQRALMSTPTLSL